MGVAGLPLGVLAAQGGAVGGALPAVATAATSFTTVELISGGLTAASGLASIASGFAGREEAELQSKFAVLGAQKEALEGRRVAILALEEANEAEGRQVAGIASAGITFEGTPEVTLARTQRTGRFNIESALLSGAVGAAAKKTEAAALRAKGRASITGGFIAAAGGVQNFATSLIRRRF